MIRKHVSLNLNVRGLQQSATIAINERSKELKSQGREIFRLGLGQSPFPVPEQVVQALRDNAHVKDYLPAQGLSELRHAVAGFHRRTDGLDVRPEDVLVGPGSKELMFLLQLSYYGELLLPTPCWVSYIPQARIIGRQVRTIDTCWKDRWRMLPERLERLLAEEKDSFRPRILILNYPGNPDGGTYEPDELQALAQVARKYHVILLSDEIYGQLHHEGKHVSVARYYPEGTIVSSGLSKWCGAGGWRLGTFAFPSGLAWLRDAMSAVASETFTSVCAPVQHAAVTAFVGGPEIEEYLVQVRTVLRALGAYCTRHLRRARAEVWAPDGAFYLFPSFWLLRKALAARGLLTAAQMCEALLRETGVAMLPGEAFGRPADEYTARMAYVDFDGAEALAAAAAGERVGEPFLHSHCARVVQAMARIEEWSLKLREETP